MEEEEAITWYWKWKNRNQKEVDEMKRICMGNIKLYFIFYKYVIARITQYNPL